MIDALDFEIVRDVAPVPPHTHGLSSETMGLITSDFGAMRLPEHQMARVASGLCAAGRVHLHRHQRHRAQPDGPRQPDHVALHLRGADDKP